MAGIKVVDPKTLAVTLAQPDASFLINMRFVSPVPKKLLDGKDLSKGSKEAFFQKPIGAGPFVFVSWNVGGDFVAQRNPNYYQKGLPYLDKFTHRVDPGCAEPRQLPPLPGDIDASIYPEPGRCGQTEGEQGPQRSRPALHLAGRLVVQSRRIRIWRRRKCGRRSPTRSI